MKHVSLFSEFLRETVNLNTTRIDQLEGSVESLKRFLRASDWKPRIQSFEEQGSWAHQTIIRPLDGDEFDADLLVLVEPTAGWTAADYVLTLGRTFSASGLYKDKVKVWEYCVTITYVNDRKVDIAPCIVDRLWEGSLEVCNRTSNRFERTEPLQYTSWIKEKNGYSGSNSFRKVTRLLKYLRDIKGTFTCPSVLLTTLIGMRIEWMDKGSESFADVPTTLRTVVGRLDDWLQASLWRPIVPNPKLTSEDLGSLITADQYTNFRNLIHKYRGWIDEAFECGDRGESIKAWRRVFGDEFPDSDAVRKSSLAEDTSTLKNELLGSATSPSPDYVEEIRTRGIRILPVWFNRQPHMKDPPWTPAHSISDRVAIHARWHISQHANDSVLVAHGQILQPRGGLWFEATVNDVQPIPYGYAVHWRITNTGALAKLRRSERGGFYYSVADNRRWEPLAFRGVHIAEAFLIRTSDAVLVGRSPPFNVVIE